MSTTGNPEVDHKDIQGPSNKHSDRYFCCITGAIGAGKTTLYNYIIQELCKKYPNDVHLIREYIDGPMSRTSGVLLESYLKGMLTDACFQNYIQSYYINELSDVLKTSHRIILMERCMSDSVAVFCNKANKKGKLSNLDMSIMYDNCIRVDSAVNAPNYFNKNSQFTRLESKRIADNLKEVLAIIENDLKEGVHSRVIGLSATSDVCFQRITERARTGESGYSQADIDENVKAYERLYEMLQSDSKEIRLLDLGYMYK